jgi:hypothetical protein
MSETFGPYNTESATYTSPLYRAWRDMPVQRDGGQAARDLQFDHLTQACKAAGVELGEYDTRILRWLAAYETASVQVVIGVIGRAYAAGIASTKPGHSRRLGSAYPDDVDPCGTRPVAGPEQPQGVPATDPDDLPMHDHEYCITPDGIAPGCPNYDDPPADGEVR